MTQGKKALRYSELTDGEITKVTIDGLEIALYNVDGQVFATDDMCTHDECSLEDFGEIEGDQVECICHGAMFDIATGQVTRGPATEPLRTYKVSVVDDDVWIEL